MNGYYLLGGKTVQGPKSAIYRWLKSDSNEFERTRQLRKVSNNYANKGFTEIINKLAGLDYAIAMAHCIEFNLTIEEYNSLIEAQFDLFKKGKNIVRGNNWEKHMYLICEKVKSQKQTHISNL